MISALTWIQWKCARETRSVFAQNPGSYLAVGFLGYAITHFLAFENCDFIAAFQRGGVSVVLSVDLTASSELPLWSTRFWRCFVLSFGFHVLGLSVLKQLSSIVSISLGLLRQKVNLFAEWTKLCPHLHTNQSIRRSHYEYPEASLVLI